MRLQNGKSLHDDLYFIKGARTHGGKCAGLLTSNILPAINKFVT